MSEEPPPKAVNKWRERIFAYIAIGVLLMFAACSGLITFLEFPLRLAFGWIWHLVQGVPVLLPQWPELLLPLACLAVATWLAHRFIRWWLAAKGSALDWRGRHTVSAAAIILLGSAAAIALSGVAHQAVWLADAPWWTNGGRAYERTEAMNKIRQLHRALVDFESEHGRPPDSLEELDPAINRRLFHQSPSAGEPPEPIVYLKPGDSDPATVVLVSPLLESLRERVVVGFRSGEAKSLPVRPGQLEEILETRREPARKARE